MEKGMLLRSIIMRASIADMFEKATARAEAEEDLLFTVLDFQPTREREMTGKRK